MNSFKNTDAGAPLSDPDAWVWSAACVEARWCRYWAGLPPHALLTPGLPRQRGSKTTRSNSKTKHARITRWGMELDEATAGESPVAGYSGVTARNPNRQGESTSACVQTSRYTPALRSKAPGPKRGSLDHPERDALSWGGPQGAGGQFLKDNFRIGCQSTWGWCREEKVGDFKLLNEHC